MVKTDIDVVPELKMPLKNNNSISDLYHDEIRKCIEVLKSGGVILYPTDTIWGLGCDATNEKAVDKIYQIKQRDDSKSLIVLIDDESKLNRYVREVPEVAWDLIDSADKPLTIVYPNVLNLAKKILAPDGSCGIRITKHEFCKQLIFKFGKPITSTSANISGSLFDGTFNDIAESIKTSCDYVVSVLHDAPSAKPSSIIRLEAGGKFEIIRH